MPKQKQQSKLPSKVGRFSPLKNFSKPKLLAAMAALIVLPAAYLGVSSFEHSTFAGTVNIGTDSVLPSTTNQAVKYKGATQYSVTETGTINSVTMYMDGKAASRGSQVMQMAVYSDNNGSPANLLGTSSTQTINAGAAATWKNFPLTGNITVTAGTKIWLSSYSPSGSNVVRIFGDSNSGYKSIYNQNSGTAPSSTFGSGTTYTGRQSYYAIETVTTTTPPPAPTPTPPSPTPTPPTPTPGTNPSAALSVWKTALGNTVNAPAKWLAIGESLTEGQGASTRDKRWLDLDRDKLRTNYTTTGTTLGGMNYIPAIYRVYAPDSLWSKPYTSSKGTLTPVYTKGNVGYRALSFPKSAYATYPVNGDSVDLWYVASTSGGSFTYKVDNGAAVTVNTNGAYNASARVQNISLGSTGSHNITITSTSGTTTFSGISVFKGDRTKGVQVYEAGWSGALVSTFLADKAQFHQTVANIAPQLITIELGGNDFESNTPPATYKAQLQQMIDDFKTLPNVPSIVLLPPYECYASPTPQYPWSAYANAAKELAAADPDHVMTYAISDYFPKGDTSGRGYYRTDGIHPNDNGQAFLANLVYGAITQ